jgi:hypothetical protein
VLTEWRLEQTVLLAEHAVSLSAWMGTPGAVVVGGQAPSRVDA